MAALCVAAMPVLHMLSISLNFNSFPGIEIPVQGALIFARKSNGTSYVQRYVNDRHYTHLALNWNNIPIAAGAIISIR